MVAFPGVSLPVVLVPSAPSTPGEPVTVPFVGFVTVPPLASPELPALARPPEDRNLPLLPLPFLFGVSEPATHLAVSKRLCDEGNRHLPGLGSTTPR